MITPNFFDYEKRSLRIKDYLNKNYQLKINDYSEINFKPFPVPILEIKNVESEFNLTSSSINSEKIILYPNFFSIYNYDNFSIKKLIISNSETKLNIDEIVPFVKQITNQKKNFHIKKLNLKLLNKNNLLLSLNNIYYENFNNTKNKLKGEAFNNKFETFFSKNFERSIVEIPEINFKAEIELDQVKEDLKNGVVKLNILDSKMKFNFTYFKGEFKILNSFFRNKNLSFKNNSVFTLDPFFNIKSIFQIEDINPKILKRIDLNSFLNSKKIIEKINSKSEIIYIPTKFNHRSIDEFNLKINLEYGRINYRKLLSIEDNLFKCDGFINLFDDFPILTFDCIISSKNKSELLKIFSVKSQEKNSSFKLSVIGELNILNNKVSFKKVRTDNYNASEEDLNYFKDKFETTLFDKSFLDIFEIKKIKDFIYEIS